MKRSIFYLICAVAVGVSACDKRPQAEDPVPSPTPTPAPPAVGEKLEPNPAMPANPIEPRATPGNPANPDGPLFPGVTPGSHRPGVTPAEPPHRKPPVSARMEV